jgi:hypothetical protein
MEETLRSPATLRGRIAEAGPDVPFGFQTIQGGVDSADRDLAFGAELDLLPDRNSVRAIRKAHECKDNDVFEFAEVIATGHYLYNIDEMVRDKQGDALEPLLIGDEVDGVLRLPNKSNTSS